MTPNPLQLRRYYSGERRYGQRFRPWLTEVLKRFAAPPEKSVLDGATQCHPAPSRR